MTASLSSARQASLSQFFSVGGESHDATLTLIARRGRRGFVRCANLLSHPLAPLFAAVPPTAAAAPQTLREALFARCLTRIHPVSTPPSPQDAEEPRGNAISVMRLSRDEALLAVGTYDGALRIYDVDEVHAPGGASRWLTPVLTVAGRRSVACIAWSAAQVDGLAVGFESSPQLFIYDLGAQQQRPERVLQANGAGRSSGHRSLCFHQKMPQTDHELLIAGSASGHLRCWALRRGGDRFLWCLSVQGDAPIAHVEILPDADGGDQVVAMTSDAVLAFYSLHQLTSSRFASSQQEPLLLRKLCLHHQLQRRCVRQYQCVAQRYCALLLDGGRDVPVVDLALGTIVQHLVLPESPSDGSDAAPETNARRGYASHELSQHAQRAAQHTGKAAAALLTAGFPVALVTQAQSVYAAPLLRRFRDVFTHYSTSARADALRPTFRHALTATVESCLVRSADLTYTLPGRVIAATHGSAELQTSHDLSTYLCGSGAAGQFPTRSPRLRLEWRGGGSGDCVVQSVRPFYVQLARAYAGPAVVDAEPQVSLRTCLLPQGFPAALDALRGAAPDDAVQRMERIGKWPVAITAVTCCQNMPAILLGHADGRVSVAVMAQTAGEEEDEDQTVRSRAVSSISTAPSALGDATAAATDENLDSNAGSSPRQQRVQQKISTYFAKRSAAASASAPPPKRPFVGAR